MQKTELADKLTRTRGRQVARCDSCGADITTTPFATLCRDCTGRGTYRVQTVGRHRSIYEMQWDDDE